MFLKKQLAARSAESALKDREAVLSAIEKEETVLLGLVRTRREAEIALSESDAEDSLGQRSDVVGARRRLDEASKAIERQTTRLAGLRGRAVRQASELSERRNAVKSELANHANELRTAFAAEWAKAVATLNRLMGERQALERLTGVTFEELSEPKAEAGKLADSATQPYALVESLESALSELAAWLRQANETDFVFPGMTVLKAYDSAQIYILNVPYGRYEAGALVVDGSFDPGVLRGLARRGEAVPVNDAQWADALNPAQKAILGIADEQRAEMDAKAQADYTRRLSEMKDKTWDRGGPQAQPPARELNGRPWSGHVDQHVG